MTLSAPVRPDRPCAARAILRVMVHDRRDWWNNRTLLRWWYRGWLVFMVGMLMSAVIAAWWGR